SEGGGAGVRGGGGGGGASWATTPGCGISATSGGAPPARRLLSSTAKSLPPEVYRTVAPVRKWNASSTAWKLRCSVPDHVAATSTVWPTSSCPTTGDPSSPEAQPPAARTTSTTAAYCSVRGIRRSSVRALAGEVRRDPVSRVRQSREHPDDHDRNTTASSLTRSPIG